MILFEVKAYLIFLYKNKQTTQGRQIKQLKVKIQKMNSEIKEPLLQMAQISATIAKFFNHITEDCLQQLADGKEIKHTNRIIVNRQNFTNFDIHKKLSKLQNDYKKNLDQKAKKKRGDSFIERVKSKRPKHPVSSFFYFYQLKGPQIAKKYNVSLGAKIAKIVGEQWKNMNEKQREPYELKSRADQMDYNQKIKQFKIQFADDISRVKYLRKKINKKKAIKEQQEETKPKQEKSIDRCRPVEDRSKKISNEKMTKPKGPISSFFLFYKYEGEKLSKQHQIRLGPKLIKIAAQKWKIMSKQQKKVYQDMSLETRKDYYKKLETLKNEHQFKIRSNSSKQQDNPSSKKQL